MLKRLLAYVPTRLPVGMTEFHLWASSIIELLPAGLENVPEDDKKYVMASAIQRLDHTANFKAKMYFVKLIHKAASSQVAGQIFLDIKERQQKALEEAQKQAADTASKNTELQQGAQQ